MGILPMFVAAWPRDVHGRDARATRLAGEKGTGYFLSIDFAEVIFAYPK